MFNDLKTNSPCGFVAVSTLGNLRYNDIRKTADNLIASSPRGLKGQNLLTIWSPGELATISHCDHAASLHYVLVYDNHLHSTYSDFEANINKNNSKKKLHRRDIKNCLLKTIT